MSTKDRKAFVFVLAAVFLLSLISLYTIGFFTHPSSDDCIYGLKPSAVFNETHSVLAVIKEAFVETGVQYNIWQGNFAAIFLMFLMPGVFGEQFYFVTPLILITAFISSCLVFFFVALRKLLKASKLSSLAVSMVVTFCALQFTYKPSDSFYWYNGGMYYTFFFSLSLIVFTMAILCVTSEKFHAVPVIIGSLLAFAVGGGNFVTSLYSVLILLSISVASALITRGRKKHAYISAGIITIFMLAGLIITIIAPGNAIRQEAVGGSTGVFKALIYSFAYGGFAIGDSTTFPVAIMWILLVPVLFSLVKKVNFSFRYPLPVIIFAFCIFCSEGTPVFFAQGLRMPYRASNIIYFNYYILMLFVIIYVLGWINNKFDGGIFENAVNMLTSKTKSFAIFAISLACAFAVGCVGLCNVTEDEDGGAKFTLAPMSVSAAYSLINGDAKAYDRSMDMRAEYLASLSENDDAVVEPCEAYPDVIVHAEITDDIDYFRNQHTALFYGVKTIKIK